MLLAGSIIDSVYKALTISLLKYLTFVESKVIFRNNHRLIIHQHAQIFKWKLYSIYSSESWRKLPRINFDYPFKRNKFYNSYI